ncbi:15720_t:CDS:2, partial [Cetraspora pellucida]
SGELLFNYDNSVYNHVSILKEFFIGLKNEGVLPAFVFLDKDSKKITAIKEISWYNETDWCLFARAAYPKTIPIARTIMITESYWCVLKYNYKYYSNQPHLDHLTEIIIKELIPNMINT